VIWALFRKAPFSVCTYLIDGRCAAVLYKPDLSDTLDESSAEELMQITSGVSGWTLVGSGSETRTYRDTSSYAMATFDVLQGMLMVQTTESLFFLQSYFAEQKRNELSGY
jgi:hypothetical protein